MKFANVSGIRAKPDIAKALSDLDAYISSRLSPDAPIYVGVNRHDIVIVGDTGLYYVLDRPSATRYQELHPAITDTAPIQREIMADLENKDVYLIILKNIFGDKTLDTIKATFLVNLPDIGATLLDDYIVENYAQTASFGR